MRIVFDYELHHDGAVLGTHYIDTTSGVYSQVTHPALGKDPVDIMVLINALYKGAIPIAGTGWEEITKLPQYPNKTRLDVLISEIIRLDDRPSRAILGV